MTGFEPLIGWGVGLISSIATDIFKERAKKLANKWDFDVLDRELRRASKQYIENYEKRHGQLKVVCAGMNAPVKLDEVYTAVQFLDSSTRRYFESADSLEDWFRESGKRGFSYSHSTKQKGIEVANREQYLLVLGEQGVGKSTFLRKVGLEALKGKQGEYEHRCIPVILELRLLTKGLNIARAIAEEFAICGFPEAKEFTIGALKNGKLLVLLDGLDEVPSDHLNSVIQQIQILVDRYGGNRFITSCRTAAYHGGFQRFKDVMMSAFEDEQIEQFIQAWFRSEKDQKLGTAQKCWELLSGNDYTAAKELAQTPLLLTLLCVVYDQLQDFPKKRAPLYGEALDVLLSKWAAEKRLERDPIYQELSPELERDLLSEIAYDSFADDQLFFSQQMVTGQIKDFLVNNLNAPKHLDSEAVLDAIELQQGILVERARDTYSFSHLTLQEYLTAKYIVDNQQVDWLVENHLTNQRWREVFLLVAGFMPGRTGADTLLKKVEQQVQIHVAKPKLQALLRWADEATDGSESSVQPAVKRAAAVFLALARTRDLARDLALASNLAHTRNLVRALSLALDRALSLALDRDRAFIRDLDLARDLTRALASEVEEIKIFKSFEVGRLKSMLEKMQQELPDNDAHIFAVKAFVERIWQAWFDVLRLDANTATLSEEEVNALNNYLYANELMVCCKEAAVRVSPDTWAGIEDRMLRVTD